jgi:hypothetical protein
MPYNDEMYISEAYYFQEDRLLPQQCHRFFRYSFTWGIDKTYRKCNKILSGDQPHQVAVKKNVSRTVSVLIIRETDQSRQVYIQDILGSVDISVP